MKSLLSNLFCASLLVLAIGCGKDGGGGSGGGQGNLYIDPMYGANPNTQQLIQGLNSWYNGNDEGTRVRGEIKIQKVQMGLTANQKCKELDLMLFKIPYCYSTSSSNSGTGNIISTFTAYLQNDGAAISSRSNPELQALFNRSAGQIVQATDLSGNGTIVRLEVLQNNTITSYIIDTTYHSLLNPVQKVTNNTVVVTQAKCPSYDEWTGGPCIIQ